jgi:UPF0176 protein
VYQLDGGILNYLKQKPNQSFEGECFVFDTRVAVDQSLQPTRAYKLCPHCGQPAEKRVVCVRCDSAAIVCSQCIATVEAITCSKNCAHHFSLTPGKKGRSQKLGQLRADKVRSAPIATPMTTATGTANEKDQTAPAKR